MDDAHDAPEAAANDAMAASSNKPPDLLAVECGQATQNSPVGPISSDSDSAVIMTAAV